MNLSQLMLNVYRDLGKVASADEFTATGGSVTSIINTEIATRETPYDDNYGYGFGAFVVRDAGGASAAPENEYALVSNYVQSTNTFTIGTISAAVASGDTIALANNDIPLRTMVELANRMLKDLGRIELVDASLTTASSTGDYDYTLPVTAKYGIRRVEVHDWIGDSYRTVYERDVTPAAPGSTGLLTLPNMMPDLAIKLWYDGVHQTLTAYNSPVSETITDQLAITGLTAYALQWYNGTIAGEDNYWLQRESKAWNDFETAKARTPVVKSQKTPKFFSRRGSSARANRLQVD